MVWDMILNRLKPLPSANIKLWVGKKYWVPSVVLN
jgi:hypothetical protein